MGELEGEVALTRVGDVPLSGGVSCHRAGQWVQVMPR
jgi:hypothetical protein